MKDGLKILLFQAENFKRLTVVSIRPDGSIVELGGKNTHGKSSVLDAIKACFNISELGQDKPVREGEERSVVRLELGTGSEVELILTRKFKFNKDTDETTTSITVQAPDGAVYKSPQALLDGLFSSLSFDPLAFSRMDPDKQVKAVRSLLPGVDFDATAASNKRDFEARTEVNRKVRDLQGEVNNLAATCPAERPATVDTADLMQQMATSAEVNAKTEQRRANRQKLLEEIDAKKKAVTEAQARAEAAAKAANDLMEETRKQVTAVMAEASAIQARIVAAGELPPLVDTVELSKKLGQANESNTKAADFDRMQARKADLAAQEKASAELTAAMEARSATLAAAIQAAKLPVKGLSFGEDCILLNGLPFNQASSAEALRTSVAIAMSLNPKLKVIRVQDGSLLDEDGMKILAEMAEQNGYQVWIERVGDNGVGFILEDGHVKGQEITPAAGAEEAPATGKKKGKGSKAEAGAGIPPAVHAGVQPGSAQDGAGEVSPVPSRASENAGPRRHEEAGPDDQAVAQEELL